MILFVAITFPFETGGTRVAELVMDESEVEDEEVKAVEPDSWEDLLMVWLKVGMLLVEKTGAVFVLERGP